VECQSRLKSLFMTLEGIEQVVGDDEDLPQFDEHVPLMSLPRIFGTTVESVPAQVPYLHADERRRLIWRDRLSSPATGSKRKIGLAWAGNSTQVDDWRRSMPVQEFSRLACIKNVDWFSLQIGPARERAVPRGLHLIDFTSDINDFADSAAFVAELD